MHARCTPVLQPLQLRHKCTERRACLTHSHAMTTAGAPETVIEGPRAPSAFSARAGVRCQLQCCGSGNPDQAQHQLFHG